MKYSKGSAANLILIPGIAKHIIKYVAINAIRNKATDMIFCFIQSNSMLVARKLFDILEFANLN